VPKEVLRLDRALVDDINTILAQGEETYSKLGTPIDAFTVRFDDGYEADITVVSGGRDALPYIDPVLFDDRGVEVDLLEADREVIDGNYRWEADGEVYEVDIEDIN
jgi:hypothetical protein